MKFIFALFSIQSALALAGVPVSSETHLRSIHYCNYKGTTFQLTFSGRTAELEEEEAYSGVPIVGLQSEKGTVVLRESKRSAKGFDLESYRPGGLSMGSLCFGTPAYLVEEGKVAIFFESDNRPFHPKTSVVVYDLANGKVIDTKLEFGAVQSWDYRDGKYSFREVVPRSDVDSGTVKIGGETMTYKDMDLEAVTRVILVSGKVAIQSSFNETYEHWKYYFGKPPTSVDDFKKSSGWSETNKKFANFIAYTATNNKNRCVQFRPRRVSQKELSSAKWFCIH